MSNDLNGDVMNLLIGRDRSIDPVGEALRACATYHLDELELDEQSFLVAAEVAWKRAVEARARRLGSAPAGIPNTTCGKTLGITGVRGIWRCELSREHDAGCWNAEHEEAKAKAKAAARSGGGVRR